MSCAEAMIWSFPSSRKDTAWIAVVTTVPSSRTSRISVTGTVQGPADSLRVRAAARSRIGERYLAVGVNPDRLLHQIHEVAVALFAGGELRHALADMLLQRLVQPVQLLLALRQ